MKRIYPAKARNKRSKKIHNRNAKKRRSAERCQGKIHCKFDESKLRQRLEIIDRFNQEEKRKRKMLAMGLDPYGCNFDKAIASLAALTEKARARRAAEMTVREISNNGDTITITTTGGEVFVIDAPANNGPVIINSPRVQF
jgi:hypothetical protein